MSVLKYDKSGWISSEGPNVLECEKKDARDFIQANSNFIEY